MKTISEIKTINILRLTIKVVHAKIYSVAVIVKAALIDYPPAAGRQVP